MQGFVGIAQFGGLLFIYGANTWRRIDRELLEQSHVERQVQHRVHGALLRRPFTGDGRFRIIEQRMVFRVQGDHIGCNRFGTI